MPQSMKQMEKRIEKRLEEMQKTLNLKLNEIKELVGPQANSSLKIAPRGSIGSISIQN